MIRIFFITGTDTGVGKTVLTTLLVRHLRKGGHDVGALKPIASGDRNDARALRAALGGGLSLDQINPWSFRAPLSPLVAARREGRKVWQRDILNYVRRFGRDFDPMLIEGAGGLLSPLGEDFDSRDLIVSLQATPLIVVPNRLGAVNLVRLTLAALPQTPRRNARVVFMNPRRPNAASRTNPELIAEFMPRGRVHELPWLARGQTNGTRQLSPAAGSVLRILMEE